MYDLVCPVLPRERYNTHRIIRVMISIVPKGTVLTNLWSMECFFFAVVSRWHYNTLSLISRELYTITCFYTKKIRCRESCIACRAEIVLCLVGSVMMKLCNIFRDGYIHLKRGNTKFTFAAEQLVTSSDFLKSGLRFLFFYIAENDITTYSEFSPKPNWSPKTRRGKLDSNCRRQGSISNDQ